MNGNSSTQFETNSTWWPVWMRFMCVCRWLWSVSLVKMKSIFVRFVIKTPNKRRDSLFDFMGCWNRKLYSHWTWASKIQWTRRITNRVLSHAFQTKVWRNVPCMFISTMRNLNNCIYNLKDLAKWFRIKWGPLCRCARLLSTKPRKRLRCSNIAAKPDSHLAYYAGC